MLTGKDYLSEIQARDHAIAELVRACHLKDKKIRQLETLLCDLQTPEKQWPFFHSLLERVGQYRQHDTPEHYKSSETSGYLPINTSV
jgi:hypothetical protein